MVDFDLLHCLNNSADVSDILLVSSHRRNAPNVLLEHHTELEYLLDFLEIEGSYDVSAPRPELHQTIRLEAIECLTNSGCD